MIPILDERCPKCGYLTLCKCNNNIYCLGNDGCDYYTANKTITNLKINYNTEYTKQEITDIIIDYMFET